MRLEDAILIYQMARNPNYRKDAGMEGPDGRIGETEGEFSVVQWFPDGDYEYVRRWCGAEEAVKAAEHYCSSVGARLGTTTKVMITDGGDCCNFEWRFGEGVVFPPKEPIEAEGPTHATRDPDGIND